MSGDSAAIDNGQAENTEERLVRDWTEARERVRVASARLSEAEQALEAAQARCRVVRSELSDANQAEAAAFSALRDLRKAEGRS